VAFWYLVRAENDSCVGSYGTEGWHGTPISSRYTSTCHGKCLGKFFQVEKGEFTQANATAHPCTPNPCGPAQCVVAAHLNAGAKANASCASSGPKPNGNPCQNVVIAQDANPAVVCSEIPNVLYTCTCIVVDQFDCDP
jgi:hypothetical protein